MARTLHLLIKWPHIITPCGRWLFSARGSKALVRDVNSSLISAYYRAMPSYERLTICYDTDSKVLIVREHD